MKKIVGWILSAALFVAVAMARGRDDGSYGGRSYSSYSGYSGYSKSYYGGSHSYNYQSSGGSSTATAVVGGAVAGGLAGAVAGSVFSGGSGGGGYGYSYYDPAYGQTTYIEQHHSSSFGMGAWILFGAIGCCVVCIVCGVCASF